MKKESRSIFLPCGTPVLSGMTVYRVYQKEVYNYSGRERNYVKPWSGEISHYLVTYTVAKVNEAENQRSFVLRSDRGCEETFSVKGNCLPLIFAKKSDAIKELISKEKDICVSNIDKKIDSYEESIKTYKDRIKRAQKTKLNILKNLSNVK